MRREVPNPQLPGMGAQLAVLPPAAKVVVAPLMLVLGVVAIVLDPGSVFAWVLLVAAVALGGPLLLQGLGELRARQVFERERARARAELVVLQADLREVIAEKRGVERFLLERGYTSEKARRWIALECGVGQPIIPVGPYSVSLIRGVLDQRLEPSGFKFVDGGQARGSGGEYAEAHYVRGDRRLELWWRGDVLKARYVDGEAQLEHSVYLSLLGARASKRFPCAGGPASQIAALASDLDVHCAGFMDPSSDEIRRLATDHVRDPARFRGLRGL